MPAVEGSTAPLTLEALRSTRASGRAGQPTGLPGAGKPMADAFGIEDGEPWAEFAVGADFVLARVQTIPSFPRFLGFGPKRRPGTSTIEGTDASGSAGGQAAIAWGTSGELAATPLVHRQEFPSAARRGLPSPACAGDQSTTHSRTLKAPIPAGSSRASASRIRLRARRAARSPTLARTFHAARPSTTNSSMP